MWRRSCRLEVRIRRRVREKIRRISNLLKTYEVRTLSNSNANFVTSLPTTVICLTCSTCWSSINRHTLLLPFRDFIHTTFVSLHWFSYHIPSWQCLTYSLSLAVLLRACNYCLIICISYHVDYLSPIPLPITHS